MASHKVINVPVTLDQLATDPDKIIEYQDALNAQGELGWQVYHVAEASNGLVVFLQQPD